jgi:integrase
MNRLAPIAPTGLALPALVSAADDATRLRFLEFFAVTIRNSHTRRAYARAAGEFLAWCEARGVVTLTGVQPLHVAAWIEALGNELAAPSVKQRLAGVRHLFDWLVSGHILPVNPAASVRGPAYSARRGKTPVLAADEARTLLDSIDVSTDPGLRDRALIGLMVYSFARIGAAVACGSRMFSCKTGASGFGYTKKAASGTKCPVTTILSIIWPPISTGAAARRSQRTVVPHNWAQDEAPQQHPSPSRARTP